MITAQLLGQALIAAGNALLGAQQNAVQPVQTAADPVFAAAPQPAPAPQPQPAPSNVTADSITALIQPHIGNDAIKAALGVAMRSMGINALPETQPHQFGQLYALFQQVLAQHGVGGPAPAPAASASII